MIKVIRSVDRMPEGAEQGHTGTEGVRMATNRSLISDYLNYMKAWHASPETIRSARSILLGVAEATGQRLTDLQHVDLATWQGQRARQVSERTLRTQLTYLRGYYRWAVAEGLVERDPTARLRTPRVPMLLPRPISEERLVDALDGALPIMRAILALAAFAGLRACEIARLTWSDVYLDDPQPYLRVIGKRSKERVVDVSPELARILRGLLGPRRGPVIRRLDGEPGHVAPVRISQMSNRYLHSLGHPDTLHSLRHRFVTQVCRVGGLRRAQEAAGHASSSTTAGYALVQRGELTGIIHQIGRPLAS